MTQRSLFKLQIWVHRNSKEKIEKYLV